MQTFTNKFTIAMNQDKSEVILNFFQSTPLVPVETENPLSAKPEINIDPVANLVMTGQCASSLLSVLTEMLKTELHDDD